MILVNEYSFFKDTLVLFFLALDFVDGLKITISGGVKQYAGEKLIDFIHSVDMDLYEAKKKGKNQIIY